MSKKNLYLLGIVAVITFGTLMYLKLCSGCLGNAVVEGEKQRSVNSEVFESKAQTTQLPFTVSDGHFSLNIEDNFNFQLSNPSFVMPIAQNLKEGVATLKNHLLINDSTLVTIIGHYAPQEANNTSFSNLGLARANSVKNHFIISGIPSDQIKVLGKLNRDFSGENEILYGAVSYALTQIGESEQP
ncbi:hypothetical protein [Flagellimonas myxillae]|uniref:hypothetical protein n=1 Tax=Flagellimonas myxillae TaxID=2942214 RepID=UPI00201E7F5D|nr:hypothetical protein [Muricauda myxillae]MCL6267389.1 hypothetical protein [Muricauda myxillae]